MADELGTSVGVAAWTISGYVLLLACATPVYGRVSDLVGVRIPLLVGVSLMSIGALGATVAASFPLLLGARLLQGVGAAAVPTLGVTVLSSRYECEVRGLALGRLAAVVAAVSCAGPLFGRVLTGPLARGARARQDGGPPREELSARSTPRTPTPPAAAPGEARGRGSGS